ncbi:MAG: ADP-ribosylglycohydrolase family protein [Clostridia bacterium]|nr:ADP-ribosylglycohydrolase family protein [Clostridia bacterium]
MLGAIIGDIVGSRFEFDDHKSKEFELFSPECDFTDDSVMTLAVAKALADYDEITDYEEFKNHLVKVMHKVGGRYMGCGYGGRFYMWLKYACIEPYNSYGNGSAMRVSPVAWFASSLEECEKLARATAEVTHNHPEGIKGAVSVAGAIYLARTGHTMDEIKEYVSKFYTIDFTLDEIREEYEFEVSCQKSVPQAFEAFFESTSFEDTIRNAISIGGDSDTIAAIAGSIAQAYYGIDEEIKETALSYLDEYLLGIAEEFEAFMEKNKAEFRYSEPGDYFSEEIRKKYHLGEYAEDDGYLTDCGGIQPIDLFEE